MDIEDFLEKEVSDLGVSTDKTTLESNDEFLGAKDDFEQLSLFDRARKSLAKGDLVSTEQMYNQMWIAILEQKFKWNKQLYDQIGMLNRLLMTSISSTSMEMKKKMENLNLLLIKARNTLKEGKIEAAFKITPQIQEIFNSIPGVFFEEKRAMQEQINDFNRELRMVTDGQLIRKVASSLQEIFELINKVAVAINSNSMQEAMFSYNKCVELFKQIPEGFVKHKNIAALRLLDIYKAVSIYNEILDLERQLGQPPIMSRQVQQAMQNTSRQQEAVKTSVSLREPIRQKTDYEGKEALLKAKNESAKIKIQKGMYDEASKDIEEVIKMNPSDAEAMALRAKIKTLQ